MLKNTPYIHYKYNSVNNVYELSFFLASVFVQSQCFNA
jgi:hypothetical protein